MNKVTIVGRLGKDPELKNLNNDKKLVSFSVATNDGYGENKKTNWHNCTAFGKAAELISKYVKKGDNIAISGTLDYSEYEGKWYTKILVSDFTFLGDKRDNNQTSNDSAEPVMNQEVDDSLPF